MTQPPRPDPDRDPLLDAAWKAHSTELPPARVDAAVLAAAHREARTRPQPVEDDAHARARAPFRPWWGLAAAATIGAIAFGVLQVAPLEQTQQPTTIASDVPREMAPSPQPSPRKGGEEGAATAPRDPPAKHAESGPRADAQAPLRTEPRPPRQEKARAEPVKPPAPAPRDLERPESRPPAAAQSTRDSISAAEPSSTLERALPRPFPAHEAPSVAAPPPAAPPTELAKTESQASGFAARRRESDERRTTPSRANADAAAPAAAAAAPVAKLAARSPAAWIERIRMLHAEQRFHEAARELNAFRDAYPDADARLPESLREWAASVARIR